MAELIKEVEGPIKEVEADLKQEPPITLEVPKPPADS